MTIRTKTRRSMQAFPKAVLAVTMVAASGLIGLQAMASNGASTEMRAPSAETNVVASVAASRNVVAVAAPSETCGRQVRVITTGYNIPSGARCATAAKAR